MRARRAAALLGWGLAAVVVAGWLALVEVFWLPLRVGGVPVPVSVPAAVVGNLLLVRGAHRWSGSRLVAVLPAVVWLAVVLAASFRRPEGDLVITGGGLTGIVNTGFLLVGVVAAAYAVGRVVGGVIRPRSGSASGGAR